VQTLEPGILGDLQRQSVLWSQLFQLREHAIRDGRDTFGSAIATSPSSDIDSHLAIKQSIMPCTSSILFWIEKLIKFVSTSMRNGGPRSVLCDRKSDEDACALRHQLHARRAVTCPAGATYTSRFSFACFSFSAFFAAFSMFSFLLMSHHSAAGRVLRRTGAGRWA
jgi:hypothetical protein